MSMINRAIEYASNAHVAHVQDYGDIEYVAHCLKVSEWVGLVTKDEEELAAAILHDTIRVAGCEYQDIAQTFSPRVANIVDGLGLIEIADQPVEVNNIWVANFIDTFPAKILWAFESSVNSDLSSEIRIVRSLEADPLLVDVAKAMLKNWQE